MFIGISENPKTLPGWSWSLETSCSPLAAFGIEAPYANFVWFWLSSLVGWLGEARWADLLVSTLRWPLPSRSSLK